MKENFLIKNPLFKIIACATMLGMVASCSDYLDKYQDEAIIAAENTDDEISSSSESDVFSSASVESNGSIAFSSSVAVSSGSIAVSNSSAKSSSSIAISNSSANDKSSSSVATSSSSEEPASSSEGCTGTVIFDKEWQISSSDSLLRAINKSNDYKYFYDIANWKGICLEYQSKRKFYFGFGRASDINLHKYTAKVVLTFTSQSTRGIQKQFWTDSDKFQRVQLEILSASNIIQYSRNKGLNDSDAVIYKATAITNESFPEPTDFFKVVVKSDTVKWKVDDNTEKMSIYQEPACPSGWQLPSNDDFYNLAKAIDSVVSNVYDTLDFTYTALAKEKTINNFNYKPSKDSTITNTYGFWTSDKKIITLQRNDSIDDRKRFIMKTIIPGDSAQARVRCIKKDN